MSSHGGTRNGSGRPMGSLTKRNREIASEALLSGQTPLEFMLSIMRNEDAEPKDRQKAAESCAPFLHPRISTLDRTVELELPDTSTPDGISEAVDCVLKAVATGQIAPSEGQSVISVIDAKRKAFESSELLERIKRIEDALEK